MNDWVKPYVEYRPKVDIKTVERLGGVDGDQGFVMSVRSLEVSVTAS